MKKLILASAFLATFTGNASALMIATTTDGSVLAGAIAGSGITIDVSPINYIGGSNQGGNFTDGIASGVGDGIILTSDNSILVFEPNSPSESSGDIGVAVSEPATIALLGFGLVAFGFSRKKKST